MTGEAQDPRFAATPTPPYYIVTFTSQRTPGDQGYGAMAERMAELAAQQPGFLGMESVRDADGYGITLTYWESEEAIRAWRDHLEHRGAQRLGHEKWYERFILRAGKVERESRMERRRA